jgi:biopolymer transport protein ExbD
MPETPDEEKFIDFSYDSVVVGGDGHSEAYIKTRDTNASREEAREMMAAAHGMDPADVVIGADEKKAYRQRTGRLAVGFSRWNSSWDPGAEQGDPTLN